MTRFVFWTRTSTKKISEREQHPFIKSVTRPTESSSFFRRSTRTTMTMHETTTTTEETHLLEREGGFSRRKQIASAVGVFALAIGGVAVAGSRGQFTSSPTYSSRLRAERRAKLGAPETPTTPPRANASSSSRGAAPSSRTSRTSRSVCPRSRARMTS